MIPTIEIERATYAPGSVLRGRVALEAVPGEPARKVELSVLWETEGKGNTDRGVVLYRLLSDGHASGSSEHAFEATLPALPLSYDGHLVKIGWRVRVRVLALLGDDGVFEEPFRLEWPA